MTRRSFAPSAWIFFVFSLVACSGFFARNAHNERGTHGVVVAPVVSVRSEASDQSLELYQLQHASEFRVLDRLVLNQSLLSQDSQGTSTQSAVDSGEPAGNELYPLSMAAKKKNSAPGTWYRIRFDANTSGFVPAEAVLVY